MGEGYTFLQLRTKVRDVLRDNASTDSDRAVPDSQLSGWLNEAVLDIAWRAEVFSKEVTGSWSGAWGYQFPLGTVAPELIRVVSFRLGTDDAEPVDDQLFWDWKDSGGTPSHPLYRVFGGNLEVYPTPATGTAYALREVARPALLLADADLPDIPQTWQIKAVRYAAAMASTALHEFADADRYMALYEAGLPPRPNHEKRIPGPIQLVPDLGPFDQDPDTSRHIF